MKPEKYWLKNEKKNITLVGELIVNSKNYRIREIQGIRDRAGKVCKLQVDPSGKNKKRTLYRKLNEIVNGQKKLKGRNNGGAVAWPLDLLLTEAGGTVKGYTFSSTILEMDTIDEYYNPKIRKSKFPGLECKALLDIADNLAKAFHLLHRNNFIMGNIRESNIKVSRIRQVVLTNTESFQVRQSYPCCEREKPTFTPPECFKNPGKKPDMFTDRFGLGVLIFLLLMEGRHPFGCSGDKALKDLKEHIKNNHFPYGDTSGKYKPKRGAPRFYRLFPKLQEEFYKCFVKGHTKNIDRPDGKEWRKVLEEVVEQECRTNCYLNKSAKSGLKINTACPWCPIEVKVLYALLKSSPQKTSQLTRIIKEDYSKTREACDVLCKAQWITGEKRKVNLYFFPAIKEVVDFRLHEIILELKIKIQQYRGDFKEIREYFNTLRKSTARTSLIRKLKNLETLLKVVLATNGIGEALKLFTIFPFIGEAYYWSINDQKPKSDVEKIIRRKLKGGG